jgi:hypothetical protein
MHASFDDAVSAIRAGGLAKAGNPFSGMGIARDFAVFK